MTQLVPLLVALALLLIGPPAPAQPTLRIATTPSFIFLPIYAAEHLAYLKAESISARPSRPCRPIGVVHRALTTRGDFEVAAFSA